jgi:hypothetical protein
MTKEVFESACRDYLASHLAHPAQRDGAWAALLAAAAAHAAPHAAEADGRAAVGLSDSAVSIQVVTGGQWCGVFAKQPPPPPSPNPPSIAPLPDLVSQRATTLMAALLFFNGLSVQGGFMEFAGPTAAGAEAVAAEEVVLTLDALTSRAAPLLENVSQADLAHWYQKGLCRGGEKAVCARQWAAVMQPAAEAHCERVCKEYMMALGAAFRSEDAGAVVKRVLLKACAGSGRALSLADFVSALRDILLQQAGAQQHSLLRAAGDGGLHMMCEVWAIAVAQQQQDLSEPELEKAAHTMAHAARLLLPRDHSDVLFSLLSLAAINDVALAQRPSAHDDELMSLFDFLCDSSDADAAAAPLAAAAVEHAAPQLSRELFSATISKLLGTVGVRVEDLHALWAHLFGSGSHVDRASWNRVLCSAGIHLPLLPNTQPDDKTPPRDRLSCVLQLIHDSHPEAPAVCRAVQFECRSNADAARALLREACEHYGCATKRGLSMALGRCVHKYSEGAARAGEDASPAEHVKAVADAVWRIASDASAAAASSGDFDAAAAAEGPFVAPADAPPLLPTIIIAAVIEAMRKHTPPPAARTHAEAAGCCPSVETLHVRDGQPVDADQERDVLQQPPHVQQHQAAAAAPVRYVGDDGGDGAAAPVQARANGQSCAAEPSLQPLTVADRADVPAMSLHAPAAVGDSNQQQQQQQQRPHQQQQQQQQEQEQQQQQQEHLTSLPAHAAVDGSNQQQQQQQRPHQQQQQQQQEQEQEQQQQEHLTSLPAHAAVDGSNQQQQRPHQQQQEQQEQQEQQQPHERLANQVADLSAQLLVRF